MVVVQEHSEVAEKLLFYFWVFWELLGVDQIAEKGKVAYCVGVEAVHLRLAGDRHHFNQQTMAV